MSIRPLTKRLALGAGLLALLVGALPAAPAAGSQDEKTRSRSGLPGQDEMMAAMARYAAPGPKHEALKSLAGSWKAVSRFWSGPGESAVTEGSNEARMILGGRFLIDEYRSEFMGQPFEGFGLTGFDNQSQEFVSVWADVLSTSLVVSRGSLDPSGKVFTYTGTSTDPVDGKQVPYRMVTEILGPDKHVWTLYSLRGDQEVKEMEITYTRR